MRPMRISSEGPEVVPNPSHESPDHFLIPLPFAETAHPFRQQQRKKIEDQDFQVDTTGMPQSFPTSPRDFDPLPYGSSRSVRSRFDANSGRGGRELGLLVVGLLVVLAFLIGGGIGGGVGGAIVAKRNEKITSLESSLASAQSAPTVTTTAPATGATSYLDIATCPLINNHTFDSTTPGYQFLTLCGSEIIPPLGTENIDVSESLQSTFESCLNACADYNENVHQGGCLGASWYMFWADDPSRNSKCFLKGVTSNTTSVSPIGIVASGFLTKQP